MDYGQTGQGAQRQDVIGGGQPPYSSAANKEDIKPENGFSSTEETASWNEEPNRTESHRNIGGTAISSPESSLNPIEQQDSFSNQAPELGKIVANEPAPSMSEQAMQSLDLPKTVIDKKSIRTVGDRLDGKALGEIKKAEDKFEQTRNAAKFVDEVRTSMMPANLGNSFSRQLGEGKKAA